MCTICFYQDSRHEQPLRFIRDVLGIGYFSRRNDGMSELRINGFAQTKKILGELIPFIRFKELQAKALYDAAELLSKKKVQELSKKDRSKLVGYISVIQSENYSTKHKRSKDELKRILDLTP